MLATLRSQIHDKNQQEIKNLPPGTVIDQDKLKEIEDAQVRVNTLVNAGFGICGVIMVVCGILINKFPIPATVLSLVVYIGITAIMVAFSDSPGAALGSGMIIRVIVIVALAKAIQSAIAYEKERRASLEVEPVE
jgi:hypothetical protein